MWKKNKGLRLVFSYSYWLLIMINMTSNCNCRHLHRLVTTSTTTRPGPHVMCLDDHEDFERNGWKPHNTDYNYTETSQDLPKHLREEDNLEANGIFYFEGGQHFNQWLITSQFKPSIGSSDTCMYIKYYADTSRHVGLFGFPAYGESGEGDYFQRLASTHDYIWAEQLVKINRNKLRGAHSSIGVKTLGLRTGEYFLVDKIIIMDVHCDSISDFSKMCPAPIIPISNSRHQRKTVDRVAVEFTFPKDSADCVDTLKNFNETDWRFYPKTSFKYAENSQDLPEPLQGKLEGVGIFYSNNSNTKITPHLQFAEFSGKLPMFLYLKYYIYSQKPQTKYSNQVAITPSALDWEIPIVLESTIDFQWKEFWMEIDGIKGADLGIDIKVLQFLPGDYFLIDEIIITQGYPITNVTQFAQLCKISDETTEINPGNNQNTGSGLQVWTVVLIGFIILASTSLLVLFLWRKSKRHRKGLSKADVTAFHQGGRRPSHLPHIHARIYASAFDPTLEIPRDRIQLDTELGKGQFGRVFQGYRLDDFGNRELVAIKTVKNDIDAETFQSTLLSEIKIMSYLGYHENIACLIGACTSSIKNLQVYAVVEFCANGDLHKYLRTGGFERLVPTGGYIQQLLPPVLLRFCLGIANGMKYLTERNVVHADLAARNILLTDTMEVKISDFGLSRQLLNYSVYHRKKQEVAIPYCWMSPEALKYGTFSIQSDVWAYGVVMWEIFTIGDDPYSGCSYNAKFIKDLLDGKRLERPQWADDAIYAVMLRCWEKKRMARPSFEQLYSQLQQMLTDFPANVNANVEELESESESESGSGSESESESESEAESKSECDEASLEVVISMDNTLNDENDELLSQTSSD